jgi:S1-C subfamily serine protease
LEEKIVDNLTESSELLAALSDGLADAVEKAGASVVRVNGRRRRPSSGVIYAPGAVLTASHALEREEDVTVGVGDGRTLPARFVGRDPSTDLAVLRAEGLEAVASTAEGEPRIGELALAVGRSGRGEGPRASLGVVSTVGGPLRTWRGGRLERYIGTDATPYPGLSGGALVDARGGVLGVLTTGPMRGAALAVPAELAWRVAGMLEERGTVKRGYLGILSQPVRLPDGQQIGLTQKGGLLVVGVEDGSPAGRGGLMIGDILATLDGQPVEDTEDLLVLLSGERVGRSVPVKVVRGGEPRTLDVTVGERGQGA